MALSSIVIAGFASPLYFVVAFLLSSVYTLMIRDYIQGAREVKRMELSMRAPLITHLSETINGVVSIRAFGRVKAFREKFEARSDDVNRAGQNFLFCGRKFFIIR
jgi:ABC-type multidrug transport system fused ATPase/permease subunit